MKKLWLICLVALLFAMASYAEVIGKSSAKGIVFKDKLEIHAFDDPQIKGVTCYTTYYDRALDWNDSSSVSLSCRKTGPISGKLENKNHIFAQSKNFFFKETVVDRYYDSKRNVLVYVTYTKDTSGQNASNSISVVVVN